MVGRLGEQIHGPSASVSADGAYDGEPVYCVIAARQPQLPPAVIIPPRVTAGPGSVRNTAPSRRDRHIQIIQEKGRLGRQKAVGYGKRSLVETGRIRYKTLIGPTLPARTRAARQGE